MSTFAEFITKCEDAVDNRNTRTLPFLREATIRALKDLSQVRTVVMEGTFSFSTIADQQEYTAGHSGFPLDIQEVDAIYVQVGSGASAQNYKLDGPVAVERIRDTYYPNATAPRPYLWAWHHQTLILAPPTSSAVSIKGDYLKDATRDSSSGAVITTASTTHTNGWFERGEEALLGRVLGAYYRVIAKDVEAALFAEQGYERAIQELKRERTQRSFKGGVPADSFSSYPAPEYWR